MGIYDREYYRDETRGSGWLSGAAPACKMLILINVGVFLAQAVFPDARLEESFAAHADDIFGKGHVWQLLTANFLHSPQLPFHLIFNMLFLWMAGREVESLYGSREFVAFYLAAGVVGMLAWAAIDYFAMGGTHAPALGASGAVLGVVVLYTLYNPRREILLFFVLPIELWLLVIIYLGCDFVSLMQQLQYHTPFVMRAFAAHLGGAAYGYLYKAADLRFSRLPLPGLGRRRPAPRLRVVQADPFDSDVGVGVAPGGVNLSVSSPAPSRPTGPVMHGDDQFEARLDEVLIKLARDGRSSLTEEENRILQEASRRARDRRGDRVR